MVLVIYALIDGVAVEYGVAAEQGRTAVGETSKVKDGHCGYGGRDDGDDVVDIMFVACEGRRQ